VDLRRLRPQEWLAGVFGVVLLGSLFLDWFGGRSGWQALGVLDVVLALMAVSALGLVAITAAHRTQAVSTGVASMLGLVAIFVSVWLLVRVASPPGGAERDVGLWIGLVGCLGVTGAALRSIRDDRFPRAVRDAARVELPPLPAPPRDGAGGASSS
jgi:hypothetical protein